MTPTTQKQLAEALELCGDLTRVANTLSANDEINQYTRAEIANNATDFVNMIHAAILEQWADTEAK